MKLKLIFLLLILPLGFSFSQDISSLETEEVFLEDAVYEIDHDDLLFNLPDPIESEEDRYIIFLNERPTIDHKEKLLEEDVLVGRPYLLIEAVNAQLSKEDIEGVEELPFVEAVERDYLVTDALYRATLRTGTAEAINLGQTGRGVSVAVLDSGISSHTDLRVQNRVDFTGEGDNDFRGHGTHVAGIIGSKNRSVSGTAPEASLSSVKVLNREGSGRASDIIKGIQWASLMGKDVINISIAGDTSRCDGADAISRAITEATDKGAVVVVAAGNRGPEDSSISGPACSPDAIVVGATDLMDSVARFSSRGPTETGFVKPDIVAPGVSILSTGNRNNFTSRSGTSVAAPHVSGVVSLLLEADPGLSAKEVRSILKETATDLSRPEKEQGAGKIRADAALSFLLGGNSKIETRRIEQIQIPSSEVARERERFLNRTTNQNYRETATLINNLQTALGRQSRTVLRNIENDLQKTKNLTRKIENETGIHLEGTRLRINYTEKALDESWRILKSNVAKSYFPQTINTSELNLKRDQLVQDHQRLSLEISEARRRLSQSRNLILSEVTAKRR